MRGSVPVPVAEEVLSSLRNARANLWEAREIARGSDYSDELDELAWFQRFKDRSCETPRGKGKGGLSADDRDESGKGKLLRESVMNSRRAGKMLRAAKSRRLAKWCQLLTDAIDWCKLVKF